MISAKIIADSKNEFGERLTTMIVTFPRIILAEVNTHRMFSRNSSSSRAIPFEKMVKMVEENPFIPIKWMKDHSGMQGGEYFTDEEIIYTAPCSSGDDGKRIAVDHMKDLWLTASRRAINCAYILNEDGLTKQIVNRLLEPFMWHTAIISATEWENFFALRNHEAAEIHLQELARLMMLAYNDSKPKQLKAGEWHIPFMDDFKSFGITNLMKKYNLSLNEIMIKIATARCARISYLNFEGKDDYESDLKLYDRLAEMGHWSAFEHCAKAMSRDEYFMFSTSKPNESFDKLYIDHGWLGNFKGFIQLRKTFYNENRTDERIIKK